jgi:predicted TIM-barrel fold metal-dependent hydrolase
MGRIQTMDQIAEVIETGKTLGVEKCWNLGDVLRHGANPNQDQITEINDLTIQTLKEFPDDLLGFCFLNPSHDVDFMKKEIDRCFELDGFIGVKLEISLNCRDRRLDPVMQALREKKGILVHHSWYLSKKTQPEASEPADIANLAERHPDVRIVMAHLTGCGVRGVQDVKKRENVFIDTSGAQPEYGFVEYAVGEIGAERILYGSDIPGRDFSSQLGRVLGADISEDAKELILLKNAERLAQGVE